MDVAGYLAIVRRWWLLIVLAAVLGAAAGWVGNSAATRSWDSSARLLVGPVNADFDTLRASAELTQTYASLATSDAVLSAAQASLGLPGGAAGVRDLVDARSDVASRIVTIRASWPDAEGAAALANAVAASLTTYAAGDAARPEGELRVIDPAVQPTRPSTPGAELVALLSGLAALLAALIVVGVLEMLDDRVRSIQELRRLAGVPIAGTVAIAGSSLLAANPRGTDAAAYRSVAGMLPIAGRWNPVIAVADAELGTVSGPVAANLAAAIVGSGLPVRIVDAREAGPLDPRIASGLRALPAARGSAAEVAPVVIVRGTGAAAREVLDAIEDHEPGKAEGDPAVTFVDIADPRQSMGARTWALAADGIVLSVAIGHAHRANVRDALDRLASMGTVGAVVVAVTPRSVGARIGATVAKPTFRGLRAARERLRPPQT